MELDGTEKNKLIEYRDSISKTKENIRKLNDKENLINQYPQFTEQKFEILPSLWKTHYRYHYNENLKKNDAVEKSYTQIILKMIDEGMNERNTALYLLPKTEISFFEKLSSAISGNKIQQTDFDYYLELNQNNLNMANILKKMQTGVKYYYLNNFKKYSELMIQAFGGITISYISISFITNLLQNISNNLMKPFFDRWGKHKTFLSKLEFKIIKDTNLSEIAGYKEIKDIFKLLVEDLKNQIIKKSKMEGIILYGPPGNGKTQLVKALAGESGIPLVIVNLNTLLNEQGQIEENIKFLFDEARKKSPCIILFDEFDLIAGSRNEGKLGDKEKMILNELLQQLDGTNPLESVLVFANTNVIENIDFALQRPGRLGKQIELYNPKEEDVKKIIMLYIKKNNVNIIFDEKIYKTMRNKINIFKNKNTAMIKEYIKQITIYIKKNKIKNLTLDILNTINENIKIY